MSAVARVARLLAVCALTGCSVPRAVVVPAAGSDSGQSPAQLLARVQGDADQLDQERDGARRAQLLADASASAQQCLAMSANSAPCQYAQAQVQGLTAREHPLQAAAILKEMLASLAKAEAQDPTLDHGGPARLMAVVLLRAPPWPLGPGDVDGAVAAAQRAVQRAAAYPPNLIALAQAQAKSDSATAARASFEQAQKAVAAWTGAPAELPAALAAERSQWQRAIEQGLHDLQ